VALNVTWSEEALEDLKRLYNFFVLNNPAAAARSTTDLMDGVEFVINNPRLAVKLPQLRPMIFEDLA
jgi:plasmid stabilization system protein ParE